MNISLYGITITIVKDLYASGQTISVFETMVTIHVFSQKLHCTSLEAT